MKKTQLGVNDGDIHPTEFVQGETYEIGPDLHRAFKGLDIIEDVKAEKEAKVEYETKVIEPKKTTKKKGGKK